jgi:hypothetical protein
LVRRLQESGVAVWLPADWQRSGNDLSAAGLRELRGLLLRELPVGVPQGRLETRHVGEILAGLTRADDEHSGWWARARAWLRDVFAGADEAADEGWLARMAGHSGVSQAVLELVSYVALGLVVLLALVIAGNEVRMGGRGLRRWRLGARVPTETVAVAGGAVPLDWQGVRDSPVAQRLGLLLELVIDRLNERGSVRLARGLTVRELLSAAALADEMARERLGVLARASERVRFSGGAVSEEEVAAVMEEGRLLLEEMGDTAGDGARSSGAPASGGGP